MARAQTDLFAPEPPQADLFGTAPEPSTYRPDPDKVRRRLARILGQAREASSVPWEPTQLSLYRIIVPQMSLWLPDDEAAQWRNDFETEVARLVAA